MHKTERKQFSREFKQEAVRLAYSSGKSVAEVARELEIPVHQLYKWRSDLDRKDTKLLPDTGNNLLNTE